MSVLVNRVRIERTDRIDAILKWVSGERVLDVGCAGHAVEKGSPHWLHGRLRQKCSSLVGIDISPENVAALMRSGLADVFVQSAESFKFEGLFDTIVAGEVIEHLANPGSFLEQARAHLNRQGRLILTTPNPFSVAYGLYALLKYPKTCENPEHACWFCVRTMSALAERCRFLVLHVEFVDDYRSDDPSVTYRVFGKAMTLLRPVLPARLRKTILFVLVPRW